MISNTELGAVLSNEFNLFSSQSDQYYQCTPPDVNEPIGTTININGRRILMPPQNWSGPPPATVCELFIKRIPKNLSEKKLIPHFKRFGEIYEFRLMLDFNDNNRGYAYVKYTDETAACRAMEVLNHFYIQPGKTLEIQRSYDKCRLFVSNLPKHLTKEEIEAGFREAFPNLRKIVMNNRISDGNKNRGFAFLDFPNHKEALHVKKVTTPGIIKMWERDLKIGWATPERYVDPETRKTIKTIFIRNIHLSVNTREIFEFLTEFVKRTEILKISRVREFAFVEFSTRECAELVMHSLHAKSLQGYELELEWALPPTENSIHMLKNNDFDQILRLKCIANFWTIPIIIFGRIFEQEQVQYAAILIRFGHESHAFFFEIQTKPLCDLQSRLCEIVIAIIDHHGGLPDYNYVIKVKEDNAHIVGAITNFALIKFIKARNIRNDIYLHWDEIKDLSLSINQLILHKYSDILQYYQNNLQLSKTFTYLEHLIINDRIFGCLNPNYRNKAPLKYNLDNTQIILTLCHINTLTNYIFPSLPMDLWNFKDFNAMDPLTNLQYTVINLLPSNFTQSKNQGNLSVIYYGARIDYPKNNLLYSHYNNFIIHDFSNGQHFQTNF